MWYSIKHYWLVQVNIGGEKEKIQQSYSFKRLMADVLGETDFWKTSSYQLHGKNDFRLERREEL